MAQVENKKEVRPIVKYRVELQKRLEINKSYKERRNRAVALRILSYGLFGQKRFQNLYLSCSLNCFYWALQIATFLHQSVAGLAMIIKFDQVHVIEYYENTTEIGKSFGEKKYTKILIKLTRSPTEEDKKQPGYNPGFKSQDIKGELTEVLGRKQGGQARRDNRGRGPRRTGGDNRRNRDDRRERGERRDRQERGDRRRQERTDRGDRRENEDRRPRGGERRERREKDQYREKGTQRRQRDEYREKPRRQQREEQRDRPRRQERERYGDDRDQRRVYKQSQTQQRSQRYERGQRKTRGGSGGNYRAQNTQHRERRYEPKREQPRNERADREGRGERRPKKSRYSDDSD